MRKTRGKTQAGTKNEAKQGDAIILYTKKKQNFKLRFRLEFN